MARYSIQREDRMREATAAEKAVFGDNVKIGPDGQPIEQGIGSLSNPNRASHEAAMERMRKIEDAMGRGSSSVELVALLKQLVRPAGDLTEAERVQEAREAAEADARELDLRRKEQRIAELEAKVAAMEQLKAGEKPVEF
jgi:hypothetical protein